MTTPPAGPQDDEVAAVRGGAPAALREARDVMAAYIGSRWQPPARTAAEKDLDRAERYASADTLIRALSEAGYEIRPLSENTVDSLDEMIAALRVMDEEHGSGWSETGELTEESRAADVLASLALVRLRLTATAPSDASEEETNG